MKWNKYPETKPDIIHKGEEFLVCDTTSIGMAEWNDDLSDGFFFYEFSSCPLDEIKYWFGPLELPDEME